MTNEIKILLNDKEIAQAELHVVNEGKGISMGKTGTTRRKERTKPTIWPDTMLHYYVNLLRKHTRVVFIEFDSNLNKMSVCRNTLGCPCQDISFHSHQQKPKNRSDLPESDDAHSLTLAVRNACIW